MFWSSGSTLGICFKCPSSLGSYHLNLTVEIDKEKQQIVILLTVLTSSRRQFMIFTSTVVDGFNC